MLGLAFRLYRRLWGKILGVGFKLHVFSTYGFRFWASGFGQRGSKCEVSGLGCKVLPHDCGPLACSTM